LFKLGLCYAVFSVTVRQLQTVTFHTLSFGVSNDMDTPDDRTQEQCEWRQGVSCQWRDTPRNEGPHFCRRIQTTFIRWLGLALFMLNGAFSTAVTILSQPEVDETYMLKS